MNTQEKICQIKKQMEESHYELLYKNVTGVVQEYAAAAGRDLEMQDGRRVVHSLTARAKSAESVCKKMIKKNVPSIEMDSIREHIADLFGVRIVVLYLDDIYRIAGILKKSAGMKLLYEKDYIRNPKRSGYRGLHLIFSVDVVSDREIRSEKCEVQIRTTSMDSWAALEHQLVYKSNCMDADINEDLRNWSDTMAKQDRKMVELRKRIGDPERKKTN